MASRSLLVIALLSWTISIAAAQPSCDATILQSATSSFDIGRFDRTFDLLNPCLPAGFSEKEEKVSAYRLMALSHIARDSLEQARQSIRELLRVDGRYRADPSNDPRPFVDLVDDLRPPWHTWLWRGNEWYKWAARGTLAAGIVSLPFLLRQDTPPDLPGHPPFPSICEVYEC